MRELYDGEDLHVGDFVVVKNCFFTRKEKITKVTKILAIHRGDYTSKFRRKYDLFKFKAYTE